MHRSLGRSLLIANVEAGEDVGGIRQRVIVAIPVEAASVNNFVNELSMMAAEEKGSASLRGGFDYDSRGLTPHSEISTMCQLRHSTLGRGVTIALALLVTVACKSGGVTSGTPTRLPVDLGIRVIGIQTGKVLNADKSI